MYCEKFMQEAIRLAELGRGYTSPNPLVGAVVVKDGQIIGVGYHRKAGTEHAEVLALNMAGQEAQGAELYVTLEPCSHQGLTPPCTQRIIKEKISKVFIGIEDPNPLVAGKGIQLLKEAGIEVEVGFLSDECREQNRFFLHWIKHRRPYINLKYAMTLDGKIATAQGESKWITNEQSREKVQYLRSIVDGILVGINTILADDPQLTYRGLGSYEPYKIICDSTLKIPLTATVLTNNPHKTIIATTVQTGEKIKQLKDLGVIIINTQQNDKRNIDLHDLSMQLGKLSITSILVEGGANIHGGFLDTNLANRVYAFIAPKLMGQAKGLSPIIGQGIATMQDIITLKNITWEVFQNDILITGDINPPTYLEKGE